MLKNNKKRFIVTIEDTVTNEKKTEGVDYILLAGIIKDPKGNGINRSIITAAHGDYIALCRGYTMLGSVINTSLVKKEE